MDNLKARGALKRAEVERGSTRQPVGPFLDAVSSAYALIPVAFLSEVPFPLPRLGIMEPCSSNNSGYDEEVVPFCPSFPRT